MSIAAIIAKARVSIADLTALSGISRPTVTKILKGESTWVHKRDAVKETARDIGIAVKTKHLPVVRIPREPQDERTERLRDAINASKAYTARSSGDED